MGCGASAASSPADKPTSAEPDARASNTPTSDALSLKSAATTLQAAARLMALKEKKPEAPGAAALTKEFGDVTGKTGPSKDVQGVVAESSCVRQCVALYDFDPSDADLPVTGLKLQTGQVIYVLSVEEDWALGYIAGKPEEKGWFPSNYTISVDEYGDLMKEFQGDSGSAVNVASDACTHVADTESKKRVALYDFDPSAVDWPFKSQKPLALQVGQLIEVISFRDGEEWVLGQLLGQPESRGWFPLNYTISFDEYQTEMEVFGAEFRNTETKARAAEKLKSVVTAIGAAKYLMALQSQRKKPPAPSLQAIAGL
eukprot:TRINITY_DN78883_c0_g1_i1.p1 TRINITY_DN78883_c0_g1~~TRINITY_DN78883_c0_g1_i1.p1  ORF type:complete len:313 (-),score=91.69 TRINITY_DN78883_c0_g1_i1:69-1007(-)